MTKSNKSNPSPLKRKWLRGGEWREGLPKDRESLGRDGNALYLDCDGISQVYKTVKAH